MYRPDRIERRNRRKAIVWTTLLYGSLLAFFLLKNEVPWQDYVPTFAQEWIGEEVVTEELVNSTVP